MNGIKDTFVTFKKKYKTLIDKVEQESYVFVYTNEDYFQLEPFFYECIKMRPPNIEFYDSHEKVPGDKIFLCALKEGKIEFCRGYCSQDVYYDSFFQYDGQLSRRIQYYVNAGESDLKGVAELSRTIKGNPVAYCSWGYFGNHKVRYTEREYGMDADVQYLDQYGQESYIRKLRFDVSKGQDLLRLVEIEGEQEERVLYDCSMESMDVAALLDMAAECLSKDILRACHESILKGKSLECLLLEYTMQGPLPPSLAFAQAHEVNASGKYGPLDWLNAPDLELFSEDGNPSLECTCDSLYATINARIEDLQEQEWLDDDETEESDGENEDEPCSDKLIKEFYIKLCKTLRLNIMQIEGLVLNSNFFVVARDFEECNELEYLEAILPENQFAGIRQDIRDFEAAQHDDRNKNPDYIEQKEAFAFAESRIPALLSRDHENKGQYLYAGEVYLSLMPFYSEMHYSIPSGSVPDMLTAQPSTDVYHRYAFDGDRLLSIAQFTDGKEIRRRVFSYGEDQDEMIEIHLASGEPSIESVEVLVRKDGKIRTFTEYGSILDRSEYIYDENNRISHCNFHRSFPEIPGGNECGAQDVFIYKGDELCRIVRNSGSRENHVVYAVDDEYLDEAFSAYADLCERYIVAALKEQADDESKKDYLKLEVRVNDPGLPAMISCFISFGKQMEELRLSYQFYDDNVFENLCGYLYSFDLRRPDSKPNIRDLFVRLQSDLTKRLKDSIKQAFKMQEIDVSVLFLEM